MGGGVKGRLQLSGDFDIPGYISFQFQAVDGKKIRTRSFVINESFWVELSKELVREKGNKGKKMLYTVGKQYGYRFAAINKFPKGNVSKVTVRALWDLFEKVLVRKIDTLDVDPENKVLELTVEGFVVAEKSDFWYAPVGAKAGM